MNANQVRGMGYGALLIALLVVVDWLKLPTVAVLGVLVVMCLVVAAGEGWGK